MIFLFVIFALVLAAAGSFVFLWARWPEGSASEDRIASREPRGLFDDRQALEATRGSQRDDRREQLLNRAKRGEIPALDDAHAGGEALYAEVLSALLEGSTEPDHLNSIISYISKSGQLRANARLAQVAIQRFTTSPSVRSATEMLHVAALADDAAVYHEAVDALLDARRLGHVAQLSSADLRQLIESQFWVLALEARRGGAGFRLKRRLAGIRRELAAATPVR